jgi:hypothetical protein
MAGSCPAPVFNMPDPSFTDIDQLALNDRQKYAHDLDDDGKVIVKTSAKGTFKPTGLNSAMRITTMSVGDTEVKLPAAALSNRNSMMIQNKDSAETLYVGPTGVTADTVMGTSSGWEVDPSGFLAFDITDGIDVFAIAPSGKTITVKVMEIA